MTGRPEITMSFIAGGVARAAGHGIADCPHPVGALRLDWLEGWLASAVSPALRNSAIPGALPVKHREGAIWSRGELQVLEAAERFDEGRVPAGLLAQLLGRSARAVRTRSCRLNKELTS